jgi:hypothetical protein
MVTSSSIGHRVAAGRAPLFVGVGACVALGLTAATACITTPPPDLPPVPAVGPSIIHDAVQPPTADILASLPMEFVVPVQLDEANASFQWDVFVDYNPATGSGTSPVIFAGVNQSAADGGVNLVDFSLQAGPVVLDPSECHVIQFLVAHQFNQMSLHTWDSLGGDLVSWIYNPGGGPGGCPIYDAGALQTGAFPDASTDALPVVPESGGGDP